MTSDGTNGQHGPTPGSGGQRPSRVPPWAQAGSSGLIYAGVAVTVLGFGLIALAWGQIAGEAEVFRQLPYVVSAGFGGIGFILVGLTVVNVAVARGDDRQRNELVDQLIDTVSELQRSGAVWGQADPETAPRSVQR